MGIDAVICLAVFSGLVICITANVIHMTLAALIGVSILLLTGIITPEVSRAGILAVHPINSLFVGSMVLIRCLEPTRVFPAVAAALFRLSAGDGRRVLLLLFGIVTPLCALFPMPAVPLICLANTAGLLTLLGGVQDMNGPMGRPRAASHTARGGCGMTIHFGRQRSELFLTKNLHAS